MLCIPRKPHSEALHFPSQSHSSQRLSLPLSAALSLLFVFSIFLKPWDSLPLPRPHPSPPSFPLTMVKWQFGWSSSPVRVGPGLLTREIGEGVRDSAPQRGFFYKVSCAFRVKGMMFFPGVKLWLFLIRLIVFCLLPLPSKCCERFLSGLGVVLVINSKNYKFLDHLLYQKHDL